MDTTTIMNIQNSIGYEFKNPRLLEQAFVRKSYSQEHPATISNEVLEFYGDEALDYYVSRAMYGQFSEFSEDGQFLSKKTERELTEIKSYNVDTESLAHCISLTGFQNYLLMNQSDIKNNVQNSVSVMADLFEAIIGAVAIDSDWNFDYISNVCRTMLKLLSFEINYIKWLNNWCSEQNYEKPFYHSLTSYQNSFYSSRTTFTGAYLTIKGFDLKVESKIPYPYAAYMDCAKQAYDIIQIRIRNQIIGKPEFDTAINQLNILFQKGYIEEPVYQFNEEHDENGNPIWHCECDVDELEKIYLGDSSIKKEAKKEAAYGALCALLDYDPEQDEESRYKNGTPYFFAAASPA